MGSSLPKQFLPIGGGTILEKAVKAFEDTYFVDDILVVTGQDFVPLCNRLCGGFSKVRKIIAGGRERQDSVKNGLDFAEDGYVLIHDGARPYITGEIIQRVMESTAKNGAAVAAVKAKDTVRQLLGDGSRTRSSRTLDRSRLYNVQTPQGFETALIKEAFEKACGEGFYGTDDAVLVERLGHDVAIAEGSYENIKITTKEDLPVDMRAGTGFDVHRLAENRKLILCGVEIPFEKGLLGHSDADVALHALMDALLGAAALGDIGRHFPDTDDRYKGISSIRLLEEVKRILSEAGYTLNNADITIIAQRPKLLPYIEQMRKNIAEALNADISRISVKATTTERLGFAGREEGIAAEAVCTINRI